MSKKRIIYAISDSIGETAQSVAVATTGQFEPNQFEIIRIPYINSVEQIIEIVEKAAVDGCVICHTLVSPDLVAAVTEEAAKKNIPTFDVMGPMIRMLQGVSGQQPKYQPGTIYKLGEEYFKRIEAIEFAVKYDDGKNPQGLLKADVILVGVSRTSKTPLSMYLAHKKVKVANVPLVPEATLPQELFKAPAEKIVGLIINPEKLIGIREERLKSMGLSSNTGYANLERIREELKYAQEIMRKLKCPVLDVSNRAIEETAQKILEILKKNNSQR